jgi:hypothetical protein
VRIRLAGLERYIMIGSALEPSAPAAGHLSVDFFELGMAGSVPANLPSASAITLASGPPANLDRGRCVVCMSFGRQGRKACGMVASSESLA